MDLQFQKENMPFMGQVLEDIRDQELSQEIRLGESMKDVGNVIAAWGQVLIRGKEWMDDRIGVNGGVQVWVLYAPQDGGKPQMVQGWIPFNQEWELPQRESNGKIWICPRLRNVDARGVSERKILVRVNMRLLARAVSEGQATAYSPGQVPEDVQLRLQTEPMLIPTEMGEKSFVMDEEMSVPQDRPPVEQMIHAALTPRISEAKVMAGKLVFRGGADLHILYENGDQLYTVDLELPFAQYGELDHEFDPDATVRLSPVLTSFDLEPEENGNLRLKAGIAAQYMVYDMKRMPMVMDAYSTTRQLEPQMHRVQVPLVTDQKQWEMDADWSWTGEGTPLEVVFYPDHPRHDMEGSLMTGRFQVLSRDADGQLRCSSHKWEQSLPESGVELCGVENVTGQGARLCLYSANLDSEGIESVAGLQLGENAQKDPNRPSLILRRFGTDSLWDLAKRSGSTVEAIMQANGLDSEPGSGDMVMIPIA